MSSQWHRKIELLVFSENSALDLSEMHIKFTIAAADAETPNSASIRIYNLSQSTVNQLTVDSEFKSVSLAAGYEGGTFGTIFQGDIKQYRIGKENAVDTYLDILAADGSLGYVNSVVNDSIKKGSTAQDRLNWIAKSMNMPADIGTISTDLQHLTLPRGKVAFGMARTFMRNTASSLDATWSIQGGRIELIPTAGYMEDEIVSLTAATGLIGMPEQTDEGIRATCLLNSRLRIGRLMAIDASSINKLVYPTNSAKPTTYNSYGTLQLSAKINMQDGQYRMLVVEHEGDTRGTAWYSHIVGLAFDETKNKVLAP